jgi:amidase
MLNAMDNVDVDYVAALDANALQGKRIGVARFAAGSNPKLIALFDKAIEELKAAGAEIVEIESFETVADDFGVKSYNLLKYEFKKTLNDYLASTPESVTTRDLDALIAFNTENAGRELAIFDQSIFEASAGLGGLDDLEYIEAKAAVQRSTRSEGIDKLMRDNDVVALISPSGPLSSRIDPLNGDTWPDWAGIGYLAAIAGYPHVSVPMGTVHGAPVGLSFIAGAGDDADVLSLGYAYEQRTNLRPEPQYLQSAEDVTEIAAAMAGRAE